MLDLRVELVEMEPEQALPALTLGEFDLVVAEEYDDAPRRRHPQLEREELCRDGIVIVLPRDHRSAAGGGPVDLAELADEAWRSPHPDTAFARSALRTCRMVGGFEPDIRHWARSPAPTRAGRSSLVRALRGQPAAPCRRAAAPGRTRAPRGR